jgi:hypothetical protein
VEGEGFRYFRMTSESEVGTSLALGASAMKCKAALGFSNSDETKVCATREYECRAT